MTRIKSQFLKSRDALFLLYKPFGETSKTVEEHLLSWYYKVGRGGKTELFLNNVDSLGSNKRDHKVDITDIAISKVPFVRYREIPEEHYETLQELAKTVLEIARESNNCDETAVTYSLDDPDGMIDDAGSIAVSFGDEHNVEPLNNSTAFHLMRTARGCVIVILHNHPSLSKVSLGDVSYLLGYAALKMIVVVTNMGSINYIVKSVSYDREKALRLYKESVDMFNASIDLKGKQDAVNYFLNNCHSVGMVFEDQ